MSRVAADEDKGMSATLSECLVTAPFDTTFVQLFLSVEVANEASPETRKEILTYFLAMFGSPIVSDDLKAVALRLIVIPMLRASLTSVMGLLSFDSQGLGLGVGGWWGGGEGGRV